VVVVVGVVGGGVGVGVAASSSAASSSSPAQLVAQWEEMPLQGGPAVEVVAHILEPSATTAEEVRRSSMCKWFRDGDLCAWDARLLDLNARHVVRGRLPLAKLPSPLFEDPEAFLADFAAAFGRASGATDASARSGLDSRPKENT
ncbi:unnamed protein product, partial [Prorocentrum cordatum]